MRIDVDTSQSFSNCFPFVGEASIQLWLVTLETQLYVEGHLPRRRTRVPLLEQSAQSSLLLKKMVYRAHSLGSPKSKQHGTSSAKKTLGCSTSWQTAHVRAYTWQSNHAVRHDAGKGSGGQAFSFIAILSGGN